MHGSKTNWADISVNAVLRQRSHVPSKSERIKTRLNEMVAKHWTSVEMTSGICSVRFSQWLGGIQNLRRHLYTREGGCQMYILVNKL